MAGEQCSICLEALDGGEVALACGHRFHAACLAQMAGAVGTATTRRGALTACPNCRTVSRVALTPVATFGVGDRVLALWGHKFYPGVVDEVVDGGDAYEVVWDDGDVGRVLAKNVRAEAQGEAPAAPAPPARTVTTATTGRSEGGDSSNDDHASPRAPVRRGGLAAVAEEDDADARTASSRFWGVCWDQQHKKWRAYYKGADRKNHHVGFYDDEEEAARARDQAIRDAGLQGKRHMNVDATGALVPRDRKYGGDRSAVVAPDPARDPTTTTSKFWGVNWDKVQRRWKARYTDADGKSHHIGQFDTQEEAAHAVNAAIRRAGLAGKRRTNPVVDGRLVPRGYKTKRKRRRDEPAAAAPSTRPRN